MQTSLNASQLSLTLKSGLTIFKEITKAGLAISVLFSSVAGYLLGFGDQNPFSWSVLIILIFGGYCMVGASNAFNQVIEKDLDALMNRTKNRPIPSGRITSKMVFLLAIFLTILGLTLLYSINFKSALFGAISILIYTLMYTPLKKITPLAVFVGAFPGAIPFMLGWVAATNSFGIEAGTLFLIQFFWQFPHFWAIGWFLYDDYKQAGFYMLPSGARDNVTALQVILYTVWLIVASVLPAFGYTGQLFLSLPAATVVFVLGLWLLVFSVRLYKKQSSTAAKSLMIASIFYISLLQTIFILDKFLRQWKQ